MDGSPPKRACHRRQLSTPTSVPGRSSSAVNVRPRCGATSSTRNSSADTCAPTNSRGASTSDSSRGTLRYAATPSNDCCSRWTSRKSEGENGAPPAVKPEGSSCSATSRSGCGNPSGRISTALTMLKVAVLTPMPIPSVRTTTAAKPGCRRSARSAYRTSWARLASRGLSAQRSRRSSAIRVALPNRRRASTPGLALPSLPSCAWRMARWKVSSSLRSRSVWRRRQAARNRRPRPCNHSRIALSRQLASSTKLIAVLVRRHASVVSCSRRRPAGVSR